MIGYVAFGKEQATPTKKRVKYNHSFLKHGWKKNISRSIICRSKRKVDWSKSQTHLHIDLELETHMIQVNFQQKNIKLYIILLSKIKTYLNANKINQNFI